MRMENIENKRIRLQTEAGFGSMSFTELIEKAPADQARRAPRVS